MGLMPTVKIVLDNQEIRRNIVSFNLTDSIDQVSDSLSFTLNDVNGDIREPEFGTTVDFSVGFNNDLVDLATQYVSGFSLSEGRMTVNCKAINIKNKLKTVRNQSYDGISNLGDVFNRVAGKNKIQATVSPSVFDIRLDHTPVQMKESDYHFITRMCEEYGCFMKQRGDRMAFGILSEGKNVKGQTLPRINISREMVLADWSYRKSRIDTFGRVKAKYFSHSEANIVEVSFGDESPDFELKKTFKSRSVALEACKAKYRKLRGRGEIFRFTTRQGIPNLVAENIVVPSGFHSSVDKEFKIIRSSHVFNVSQGYFSSAECEIL